MSDRLAVLVTGGTSYFDGALARKLAELQPVLVVQGGAPGADRLAKHWADVAEVPCLNWPAQWKRSGRRSAGPARNEAMIGTFQAFASAMGARPLVLVAPGGAGTAHAVSVAERLGLPILRLEGVTP